MTTQSAWRSLAARLRIEHPIIQAPMAGGITTPELVASVSNAGGLGSFAAAYLKPDEIIQKVRAVKALTQKPYAINLFAPLEVPRLDSAERALAALAFHHHRLGLPPPEVPQQPLPNFDAQVEAVLTERPAVFSFTFGIPSPGVLERMKSRGILLVGTATTVAEAKQLEAAGVDMVVAQGSEAGGHRGTFMGSFESGMVGTMALVPQIVDAISLPVIAAGGLMDGRGVAAARVLGASGAQLGTAFLTCKESGAAAVHKAAIRSAVGDATVVTRVFSGRPGRVVANAFTSSEEVNAAVLPFPFQNAATTPIRRAAAQNADAQYMALWSGQGAPMAGDVSAAELFQALVRDSEQRVTPGL